MTTIDQRILIPASPDVVWAYISSIERNREWRVDHEDMTFITSFRKGQGARWRYKSARKEYVAEITAWYERMGYEYSIVDGGPFKTNRGRIRLQEIAEGTVIQWTFSYEVGGVLGGMRDAIGVRRSVENIIVDSLWALWRNIGQDKASQNDAYTPKMLMREAPDVQSRANYKPRHPSAARPGAAPPAPTAAQESSVPPLQVQQSSEAPAPPQPAPAASPPPIIEPPISDEDTRPRPSVAAAQQIPPPVEEPAPPPAAPTHTESEREPDFLRRLEHDQDAPPAAPPADDVFKPPQPPAFPLVEPVTSMAPEPAPLNPIEDTPTNPAVPVVAQAEPPPAAEAQPVETEAPEPDTPEPQPPAPADLSASAAKAYDTLSDTSRLSVFELFGVPRPSEEQQPVSDEGLQPSTEPATIEEADPPTREEAEPATPEPEPTPEPAAELPSAPVAEPVAKPVTESVDEPAIEPVTEPVVEPEPVLSVNAQQPPPIIIAGDLSGRVGLRLRLRRGQVRLRRPG